MKGLLAFLLGGISLTGVLLSGLPVENAYASETLVAQSRPIIKIPGRRSGPIMKIPGRQSPARNSVIVVNKAPVLMTYYFNGRRFQLSTEESRTHIVGPEDNPEVKFDSWHVSEKYSNPDVTRNLTPGKTYTFTLHIGGIALN